MNKLAWPFDINNVKQQLGSKPSTQGTLTDLNRGQGLLQEAGHAIKMAPDLGKTILGGANKLLEPSKTFGPPILHGLQSAGKYLKKSPTLAKALVGTAVLTPILGKAFKETQQRYEDDVMDVRRDPSRTVVASLSLFLEKKAAGGPSMPAPRHPPMKSIGYGIQDSFASGVGGGIGKSIVDLLTTGIGKGYDSLKDTLVTDGQRKRLIETLIRNDQIISDSIQRNPENHNLLMEAYGTMCRFAPTLSLDMNVVRSFLREVVLSGSGVNYATVKNLVETEKAIKGKSSGRTS